MSTASIAILIAALSLAVSGISLGWNIYRDVVLKARVTVSFDAISLLSVGQSPSQGKALLRVGVTNHGPGPVTIEMIIGKVAPPWRRLIRRVQHFVITTDYSIPLNPPPGTKRLEVGERLDLYLPPTHEVLATKATHLGVRDSFGRLHYAPPSDLRGARRARADELPTNK